MDAGKGATVITSIPPRMARMQDGVDIGAAYQRLCVDSWARAGLRVLSLNPPNEIAELRDAFPTIEFVPSSRDARDLIGKPTPFLTDMITVLADQPADVVGIINADILVRENPAWTGSLLDEARGSIVVLPRVDVPALDQPGGSFYAWGYDGFFFERQVAERFESAPFALGAPWWDYWLPATVALLGCAPKLVVDPLLIHLDHPAAWSWPVWTAMGRHFVDHVCTLADRGSAAASAGPIVDFCRNVFPPDEAGEEIQVQALHTLVQVCQKNLLLPSMVSLTS